LKTRTVKEVQIADNDLGGKRSLGNLFMTNFEKRVEISRINNHVEPMLLHNEFESSKQGYEC